MMLNLMLFVAAFSAWLQVEAQQRQATRPECILIAEKKRLAGQEKIDGRIKVYRSISERYQQEMRSFAAKNRFQEFPALMACWKELLEDSLEDIEANINRKKKSGALIDYEIQLRRSIVEMNGIRLKAPADGQDDFESWIAEATRTRQKFVDILFQRQSKKPWGENP